MEISNETRDRLVKDLSDEELEQELADRKTADRKPDLYRLNGSELVVLFEDLRSGTVVVSGAGLPVRVTRTRWS